MFNRITVTLASIWAGYYAFRVTWILEERKLGLGSDQYSSLPLFFRKARKSGLSPKRCAVMIEYFVSEVDAHIPRSDERSFKSRNGVLLATTKNWNEAVVTF